MCEHVGALFHRLGRLAGLVCVLWLVACVPPPPQPMPPDAGGPVHTIYVFNNGWHTGIVLSRGDLPPGRLPEAADFPKAAFLEFGWGDREYYPSPHPTIGMALTAIMTPSPAVMHLAGLRGPPQVVYREAEVLALRLSAVTFERLVAHIDASFNRPAGGRAETVARGLYRDSYFYAAHGEFYLFNTCNTWVAHKLAAARVGVSPSGVMTAEDLMSRLRDLPNVTQLTEGPA